MGLEIYENKITFMTRTDKELKKSSKIIDRDEVFKIICVIGTFPGTTIIFFFERHPHIMKKTRI